MNDKTKQASDAPAFLRYCIKNGISIVSQDFIEAPHLGDPMFCPVVSPEELYEEFKNEKEKWKIISHLVGTPTN